MTVPTPPSPAPVTLTYEPPPLAGRPPVWVVAVACSYLLLLAGIVVIPLWLRYDSPDDNLWVATAATVTGLLASWIALLWIPVRVTRRRLVTRRALLIPIVGSGFLAGLLLFGLLLAAIELAFGVPDEPGVWASLCVAIVTWIAWGVLFWRVSANGSRGVESHVPLLARRLLQGSALELLVAVPSHVIVRRREECCAGVGTGIGICCGIAVALVALGPGVLFLYHRRMRQIAPRSPKATSRV